MRISNRFKSEMAIGLAVVSALVLLGAGCGAKNQPSAPAGGSQNQAQTPPSIAPSEDDTVGQPAGSLSACDNPYYPLRNGLTINYRQTVTGTDPFTYGMSVSDVTDNSAKLSFSFTQPTPFTASQDITCENGNIKAKTYLDLSGDIGRAMSGMKMTATTKSTSGSLMPTNPKVGDSWTNGFVFESKLEGVPASAGLDGMTSTVSSENKVLAEESVTVPAGTYTALKVLVTTTASTALSNGTKMPASTSNQTEWWAKGVGMVKMTSETPTGISTAEAIEVKN